MTDHASNENADSGTGPAHRAFGWLKDNPYLLLALASLFWSGNHILGRAIAGHVPPIGISTLRWLIPALLLWPVCTENLIWRRFRFRPEKFAVPAPKFPTRSK